MTGPTEPAKDAPDDGAAREPSWADVLPWEGKATGTDKALVIIIMGFLVLMLLTLPLRPLLLASHPVLLELATGSLSAIGAGAAFASIGQTSIELVIAAGVIGMIKLNWLFWWAGRRWGAKVLAMFVPGARSTRLAERLRQSRPWLRCLAVLAASLPGVPEVAVYCLAGLARMRLVTFVIFDLIGASLMTGLVAGLGYGLGQDAVDVVLQVDRYALWISLALVVVVTIGAQRKGARGRKAATKSPATTPSEPDE